MSVRAALALCGHVQVKKFDGVGSTSLLRGECLGGFFVSDFEAVSVSLLAGICQYQNSRLRQCSFLKSTLRQFIDRILNSRGNA